MQRIGISLSYSLTINLSPGQKSSRQSSWVDRRPDIRGGRAIRCRHRDCADDGPREEAECFGSWCCVACLPHPKAAAAPDTTSAGGRRCDDRRSPDSPRFECGHLQSESLRVCCSAAYILRQRVRVRLRRNAEVNSFHAIAAGRRPVLKDEVGQFDLRIQIQIDIDVEFLTGPDDRHLPATRLQNPADS